MTFSQWVQVAKWALGALAVIAAFLLVQGDLTVAPVVKVILGAFLAFSAYVNPASIVVKAGTAGRMISPEDGGSA